MIDLQKQISMCARHHAKWKRAASFARDKEQRKRYIDRAIFWLDMQADLVSLWSVERIVPKNSDAISQKANLSRKLANYAKDMLGDIEHM